MLRRAYFIFSILSVVLAIVVAWLLLDSFREQAVLMHVSKWSQSVFSIQGGCFEFGHPDVTRSNYRGPTYDSDRWGWHFWYDTDGVGYFPLRSFWPGVEHGTIFFDSFAPVHVGPIIAGYWILLALLAPALPLLWRVRRMLLLMIIPFGTLVGTLGLWHRSYKVVDHLEFDSMKRDASVVSVRGMLGGALSPGENVSNTLLFWDSRVGVDAFANSLDRAVFGDANVLVPKTLVGSTGGRTCVCVRYWLLTLVLAAIAVPVFSFEARRRWRTWRNRKHLAAGVCIKCGYDLRATPDRCPECGTSVTVVRRQARLARREYTPG